MSLTILKLTQQDIGDGEILTADVTFGTNYLTGGEEISAEALGFRIGSEIRSIQTSQEGVRSFEYEKDPDARIAHKGKLLVYQEVAGVLAEVAGGFDLSGVTVRVTAVGR